MATGGERGGCRTDVLRNAAGQDAEEREGRRAAVAREELFEKLPWDE